MVWPGKESAVLVGVLWKTSESVVCSVRFACVPIGLGSIVSKDKKSEANLRLRKHH